MVGREDGDDCILNIKASVRMDYWREADLPSWIEVCHGRQ
jgi:hypothetical protein